MLARRNELVGTAPQPVSIAPGGHATDVVIELAPGLVVDGSVRTPDNKPVPNVRVQLRLRVDKVPVNHESPSARSDKAGRYRIAGVLAGEYMISASAEGRPASTEELTVRSSLTKDLTVQDVIVVSGIVLTSSGQPASGAEVEAVVRSEGVNRSGSMDRTTTDAQGHFRLERLGAGRLSLSARHGNEAASLEDERVREAEKKEVTIKLQSGARLSGIVTWDDGAPASGLKIMGMRRGGPRDVRESRSGQDGTFTLGPFSAGEISAVVMAPAERVSWSSSSRPEQADVTIAAGEHRTGIKLVASRRTGFIRGTVIGPDGRPIAGGTLMAGLERDRRAYKNGPDVSRAVTGPDGAFVLESLKRGTYTVWASSPDHPETERPNVAVNTDDLQLQLGRPASVTGVFVGTDGKPIPAYTLVVVPPGNARPEMRYRRAVDEGTGMVVSHPKGIFVADRLNPGSYDFVASAADGRTGRLSGISLADGEKKSGLRLVAEGGITVTGKVIEHETGQPLAGLDVVIRATTTNLRATTDPQGSFVIPETPRLPMVFGSIEAPNRTHVGHGFSIPAVRDGRADIGTIRLLRSDPKNPNRGRIGMQFTEENGALVVGQVTPDTPAAKVGIRSGDRLLSIDGQSVAGNFAAATNALRPPDPTKEIKILVQSPGEKPREVTVRRLM